MIRKLRKKFVLTAMAALLIILILILGFINLLNYHQIESRTDEIVQTLLAGGGRFPQEQFVKQGPPQDFERTHRMEAPFETRYFTVMVAQDGTILHTDVGHVAAVSKEDADTYAAAIVSQGKTKGSLGTYRYGTGKTQDGATLVVFVDRSSRLAQAFSLLRNTVYIGAAALLSMLILVYMLSGLAASPVFESLEKQKKFISDAGHELKTPLTIISANVDVLEMTGVRNEWTGSIRGQVRRMTELVNNLLTLSRMEEDSVQEVFTDVDLSRCVQEAAQNYVPVAAAKNRTYTTDIQDGIFITGDRKSLLQLCSLLLDNAMKYSNEGGNVRLSLQKSKNKILLEVINTCDELPEGNLDRLFDRFYRADSSRSRESGGFGIGLSAARAICRRHGGNIHAIKEGDHSIRFRAQLPGAATPHSPNIHG